MNRILSVTLALCLCSAPALAAKKKATPKEFKYAPAPCEFQIVFPQKYFTQQKCDANKNCYDVISYAETDKDSSVDVRVTCDAKNKTDIETLKNSDLKNAVKQLALSSGLTPMGQDVATLPDKTVSAVTIAVGKRGKKDSIYTGQYWVGDRSLMTLEAEMRGPSNNKIEKIYTGILESVKRKP